ncbi:MAG: cytochrome c oxidase assembly protein [Nocardioidaceae bacterium]
MTDPHSMLPPFSWQSFWQHSHFPLGWNLVAIVLLVGYVAGLAVARRRTGSSPVSGVRVGCWVLGVVSLVLTIDSAIDIYGDGLFYVHMIEHLMLIMVVPAFFVLGHPLTVLRAALSPSGRERFDRVVRSMPIAVLTNPLVGVAVYSLVIVETHLTPFMDGMMRHPWLGAVEQVLYLAAGYLILLTLIGYEPIRWRLTPLFRIAICVIAMTADTVVGIVLMQSDTDLFPMLAAHRPMGAPSPVHDQHIGGGIMWAGGDGLMTLFAIAMVIVLIADPARDQVAGAWLEGVRRQTLADHVGEQSLVASLDVDSDDEALAAYNRMLGRLGNSPD